jgi:dolichol kinase
MNLSLKKVDAKFSLISLLKELGRKSIHIAACGTALFLISRDLVILELLFLPAMATAFFISEKIEFFGKNISFGKERKWGGILLAIGLSIVMFVPLDYEIKKFAILVLMIADVMAAIIGKMIPIKKVEIVGAYKSIGGSTAFAFGVLMALVLSFGDELDMIWWQVMIVVLVLELFEFLNWRGIDNLTLPFAAMILASILFG